MGRLPEEIPMCSIGDLVQYAYQQYEQVRYRFGFQYSTQNSSNNPYSTYYNHLRETLEKYGVLQGTSVSKTIGEFMVDHVLRDYFMGKGEEEEDIKEMEEKSSPMNAILTRMQRKWAFLDFEQNSMEAFIEASVEKYKREYAEAQQKKRENAEVQQKECENAEVKHKKCENAEVQQKECENAEAQQKECPKEEVRKYANECREEYERKLQKAYDEIYMEYCVELCVEMCREDDLKEKTTQYATRCKKECAAQYQKNKYKMSAEQCIKICVEEYTKEYAETFGKECPKEDTETYFRISRKNYTGKNEDIDDKDIERCIKSCLKAYEKACRMEFPEEKFTGYLTQCITKCKEEYAKTNRRLSEAQCVEICAKEFEKGYEKESAKRDRKKRRKSISDYFHERIKKFKEEHPTLNASHPFSDEQGRAKGYYEYHIPLIPGEEWTYELTDQVIDRMMLRSIFHMFYTFREEEFRRDLQKRADSIDPEAYESFTGAYYELTTKLENPFGNYIFMNEDIKALKKDIQTLKKDIQTLKRNTKKETQKKQPNKKASPNEEVPKP